MISNRRRTPSLAVATLALILAAGAGAQAQTFIKADPSNWGIAGYDVKSQSEDSNVVDVVSSPERQGTITFKTVGDGMTAEIVMARSKEMLLMDASDPKKGVIYLDGKQVASWKRLDDERCEQEGFDQLAKSPAYLTLAKSLQDPKLTAPESSAKAAVAVIFPILGCGVGLVSWCTNQCHCCTNHYARNPPAGTPEPGCCGDCFSWYCGG